jgi:gamma-glutamyl phosphate reductase
MSAAETLSRWGQLTPEEQKAIAAIVRQLARRSDPVRETAIVHVLKELAKERSEPRKRVRHG